MFKGLSKYILPSVIALSALSVSVSAAFYSVSGLSKLFAGATYEVIIMAGSLEAAKLVLATLLHQYWNVLNRLLKTYLTVAVGVLILITSMGIYGFLSAAYQETANKASIIDTQIAFLEQKRDFYQDDVNRYDIELERISDNIATLSQAKARDIQVRDTTSATGFRSTISTAELRLAQSRIDTEELNRKDIQAKRATAADSLQKYQVEILEANVGNDLAAELGPLKYLSGLTGWPMDQIVNILLLVIIFVFDPLAVSMVIAANFAFDNVKKKEEDNVRKYWFEESDHEEPHEEDLYPDLEDIEVKFNELISNDKKEDWKVIHEEPIDESVNEEQPDPADEPDEEEITSQPEESKPRTRKVIRVLQKTPSKRRVEFDDGTEGWVDKGDENKIIYL